MLCVTETRPTVKQGVSLNDKTIKNWHRDELWRSSAGSVDGPHLPTVLLPSRPLRRLITMATAATRPTEAMPFRDQNDISANWRIYLCDVHNASVDILIAVGPGRGCETEFWDDRELKFKDDIIFKRCNRSMVRQNGQAVHCNNCIYSWLIPSEVLLQYTKHKGSFTYS